MGDCLKNLRIVKLAGGEKMLGSTREEVEEKLKEAAAWVTAGIVGIGVAVSLTIIFVSVGMKLILLGAAVGCLSWTGAKTFPMLLKYHVIKCPKCATSHQVCYGAAIFYCSQCGKTLRGQGFWKKGTDKRHGRTLVSGTKLTAISEKWDQVRIDREKEAT